MLTDDQELNREFLAGRAEREEEFQMLWRTFCRTIAIEERRTPLSADAAAVGPATYENFRQPEKITDKKYEKKYKNTALK